MFTDSTSKPYRHNIYGALWFDTPEQRSLLCMQSATSRAAHLAQHHNSRMAIDREVPRQRWDPLEAPKVFGNIRQEEHLHGSSVENVGIRGGRTKGEYSLYPLKLYFQSEVCIRYLSLLRAQADHEPGDVRDRSCYGGSMSVLLEIHSLPIHRLRRYRYGDEKTAGGRGYRS